MWPFSLFSRRRAGPSKPDKPESPGPSYQGVEIIPSPDGACAAARALAGRRLLAREAPFFPLADCDKAACDCRYRRFADRREEPRRYADLGLEASSQLFRQAGKCRRSESRGRRSTDDA